MKKTFNKQQGNIIIAITGSTHKISSACEPASSISEFGDQVPITYLMQDSLQLVESVGMLWCKENIQDWHYETFCCYSSDLESAIGIAPLFGAHFDMRSVALDTTTTTENTVEYGKTVLVILAIIPFSTKSSSFHWFCSRYLKLGLYFLGQAIQIYFIVRQRGTEGIIVPKSFVGSV